MLMAGGMLGICLAMTVIASLRGNHMSPFDAVGGAALCVGFGVFTAGLLYYLRWRQPLEVTPQGIDGFDIKGQNCFIRWSQMHDCVPFTAYLFVPCILVRHTSPLWGPLQIPLMLERKDEFRALVARYGGRECQLVNALA